MMKVLPVVCSFWLYSICLNAQAPKERIPAMTVSIYPIKRPMKEVLTGKNLDSAFLACMRAQPDNRSSMISFRFYIDGGRQLTKFKRRNEVGYQWSSDLPHVDQVAPFKYEIDRARRQVVLEIHQCVQKTFESAAFDHQDLDQYYMVTYFNN